MDPNFQTSFIPKKSLKEMKKPTRKRGTIGVLSVIAMVALIVSLALSGGVYFYLQITKSNINKKTEQLEAARGSFDTDLINELSRIDQKLTVAQELIDQHVAPSTIFEALEASTLKSIRFNEMVFSHGIDKYTLILRGEAKNFSSIALQSDLFGQNKAIREPVFSNLNLGENGNVNFIFSATINPSSILYKNNLGITN